MQIMQRRLLSSSAAKKVIRPIPKPSFVELLRIGFPITNYDTKILDFLQTSKDIYGDIFQLKMPIGPKLVLLFNPKDAEIAYRSIGKWPNRSGFLALDEFRSRKPHYSSSAGLLSSNGQAWYDFRSKVQTALLRPRLIKAYHERVDAVAQEFIEGQFKDSLEDGHATPKLIDHLYQWGLESTGVLAFDKRLNVFKPSANSESQEVINLVQKVLTLTQQLEVNLIWKYIGSLYPPYKEMMKCLERFEELANKYTYEKISSIENQNNKSNSSVIEILFKAGCDQNVLCTLAMDMLIAGVDTAANQISFALYYIAKYPDVQDKLYSEIKSLDIEDPAFVENAEYLRASLKEVLRMKPTAFATNRLCENPIELDHYVIEKGTMITLCHMSMSHDPRFVDEPETFRPERYIKSHPQYEKILPFVSLPFGHGPRVCVGKRFANLEMCLLLARIISKYKLELTSDSLKVRVPLLLKPDGAIPVRFVQRAQ